MTQLQRDVAGDGSWINTYQYSVPVYEVGSDADTVPVILDTSGPGSADELARVFRAGVPIPANATAAPGTDEHMVVIQPSTDTMWEFWHMHKLGSTWHARWGGRMEDISGNPGYFTDPPDWGATATSIPLIAGLMLANELRSGHIDHGLAIAIPDAGGGHVLPARRSDGVNSSPDAIPEGTRFRIAPDVDLHTLHLSPLVLMMARAVQRYGMIVRDTSSTVSFYAEQSAAKEMYGKSGLYEGLTPGQLLQTFPWRDLEAVAPPPAASGPDTSGG